ncbi:hypothetical protein [Clostridium botulinum]|uniref:hypothetical protein n=1 Tax=Clostridium botulinum TaxID=1491 RepID=UPI0024931ACF|nr:hypothetical protein [Clostridium botulinum]BDB02380.1 hypothetical protein CBOS2020_24540 [Clostridium botulinum]
MKLIGFLDKYIFPQKEEVQNKSEDRKNIKNTATDTHRKLNKNIKQNKKNSRRGKNDLSFSYVEMMKHDSYKRYKGALRQR